jgi:hypothetical protein
MRIIKKERMDGNKQKNVLHDCGEFYDECLLVLYAQ